MSPIQSKRPSNMVPQVKLVLKQDVNRTQTNKDGQNLTKIHTSSQPLNCSLIKYSNSKKTKDLVRNLGAKQIKFGKIWSIFIHVLVIALYDTFCVKIMAQETGPPPPPGFTPFFKLPSASYANNFFPKYFDFIPDELAHICDDPLGQKDVDTRQLSQFLYEYQCTNLPFFQQSAGTFDENYMPVADNQENWISYGEVNYKTLLVDVTSKQFQNSYVDLKTPQIQPYQTKFTTCLISYAQGICGRCLYGQIRVFTPYYIVCGYQISQTLQLGPLTDPTLTVAGQNWQYNIQPDDPVTIDPEDIAIMRAKGVEYFPTTIYTQAYINQTSGVNETIAIDLEGIKTLYNVTACEEQADQGMEKLADLELLHAQMTIGCRKCKANHYPRVKYIDRFGLNILDCDYFNPNSTQVVDMKCAPGKIYSIEGFIEQEEKLTCVRCDQKIPDCTLCESSKQCSLCKPQFLESRMRDAFGVENSVCLYNFCGLTGLGDNCSPSVTIKNCLKSNFITINKDNIETCERCEQDYYISDITGTYLELELVDEATDEYDYVEKTYTIQICLPKSGLNQVDLFVQSLDSGELTIQQKSSFMSASGKALDDPFLSITQALNAIDYATYGGFQEVVVNVWLFKGVHHYIDCFQAYQVDIPNIMNNLDSNMALLCADLGNPNYEKQFEHVSKVMKQPVNLDNVKYYFRAMNCEYVSSFFINLSKYGQMEDFWRECVDFENGEEKPQIRFSSEHTNFNITNFAQFENIQFTGEDLFASASYGGVPTPILKFVPMKKCRVTKEPYDTISEMRLNTVGWLSEGEQLVYTCDSGFDFERSKPPYQNDARCFLEEQNLFANSMQCTGEPYHDLFFNSYEWPSGNYVNRHKVIFNLYAFDKYHSSNRYPPELKLINCDFKYFTKHDALVQVETKNFALMGTEQDQNGNLELGTSFLMQFGEDRGARITIEDSTVKHSSFCKGMVYYDKQKSISFEDEPLLVNITANFDQDLFYFQEDYEPFILLRNNVFNNIGYTSVQQGLMMNEVEDRTNLLFEQTSIGVKFPVFKNQGQILNLRGFAGKVQVSENTITKSIAYIQQLLLTQQSTTTEYNQIDSQEMFRIFGQKTGVFYRFRECFELFSRYLFQEVIDPNKDFDDQSFVDYLETISPFFFKGISRTVVFQDNEFRDNIGTTGGVIHLQDQDLRFTNQTGLPAIVIRRNSFKNNMAYFAGNAFHISLRQRFLYPNWDAMHVCGAGILIEDNFFKNNIGLKRHNGGAGVLRCTKTEDATLDHYSGLKRNMTVQEISLWNLKENKAWEAQFLDPATHLTQVGSIADTNGIIKVLTYGTLIRSNTFERNYSGMRGSALLIDGINELQIVENNFFNNGPVTAYMEIAHSPYYKFFTYNNRTLAFHLTEPEIFGECMDETQYFRECRRENYQIDMPMVQGTVYVENCKDPRYCYLMKSDVDAANLMESNKTETKESVLAYRQTNTIYQHLKIDNNFFYDNKANVVLQRAQEGKQAASLFIQDGKNNFVTRNKFSDHYGFFNEYMMSFSWDLHRYMPTDYFKYSQAPLIQVEYNYSFQGKNYAQTFNKNLLTQFESNIFENNHNFQVLSFSSLRYKGSLIQLQSDMSETLFSFVDNTVERNKFLGPDGSLFFISGGQTFINNNYFGYNGRLSNTMNQATPTDYYREYEKTEFPYESYNIFARQTHGIFHFEFNAEDMPTGMHHNVFNNTFEHIYCFEGCAYYISGSKMQQFSFKSNVYQYLVAESGAVLKHLNLGDVNGYQRTHINFFTDELIRYTMGGAIVLWANNIPITIVENSKFDMNFGQEGSSLSFYYGGALFVNNCTFTMTEAADETVFAQKTKFLFESYESRLPIERLVEQNYLEKLAQVSNYLGQVMLSYTLNALQSADDIIPYRNNQTLASYILETYDTKVIESPSSQIKDSIFFKNFGQVASALMLDNSRLDLTAQENNYSANLQIQQENFLENFARNGTTVVLENSIMVNRNIYFMKNRGQKGGAIFLDAESQFYDTNSVYQQNESEQGGVFNVINNCLLIVKGSQFIENVATSTSIVYSMYNGAPDALTFENCLFSGNKARTSYSMQLLNSKMLVINCEFVNNIAQDTNHGMTLIRSDVQIRSTEIYWTADFARLQMSSQVQTGFFRLLLGSNLYMSEQSSIHDLIATSQAILSADSMSSLFFSDGVKIERNLSTGENGSTFSLLNTMSAQFDRVYFADNQQIAIKIDVGSLQINESTFTRNEDVIVEANASQVDLKEVVMKDSPHLRPTTKHGHGLSCHGCTQLQIENSQFTNLTAVEGGSIYLKNFQHFNDQENELQKEDSGGYIRNSTFSRNSALNGGAIYLENTRSLAVESNQFLENEAIDGGLQGGGAILHSCPNFAQGTGDCDVSLDRNLFANNSASIQGGALRYLNKNFRFVREFTTSDPEQRNLRKLNDLDESIEIDTNVFENNTAIYGADFASFPHSIVSRMPQKGSGVQIYDKERLLQFASGQELQLEVYILDQEGRIYNSENSAVCNFQFLSNQTLGSKSSILGNQVVAVNGVFNFTRLTISIEPDTAAQVTIDVTNLADYDNTIAFMDDSKPHIYNIFARSCVEGEQYTSDLKCLPCPKRFFLYVEQTAPGICENCPNEAVCYGMNTTAPRYGYWRSNATNNDFYPCFREESCIGGNLTEPFGICETGYNGIMCTNCDKAWARQGSFGCRQCPDLFWNFLSFFALTIVLVGVVYALVRSTLGGVAVKKPLYSVYFRIFMNHFQILSSVANIDFRWPDSIKQLIAAQQSVAEAPASVLNVDCLLMDIALGDSPPIRMNYLRLVSLTLLPFGIFALSFIFWNLYAACNHVQQRSEKVTATTVIVLFLFYPTIVQALAQSVNCIKIDGESRLFKDLEEICFEGNHLWVVILVSIPGLLAWAVGIPIYALIKLRSNIAFLEKIKQKSQGKQHEDLMRSFKVRLGFLTAGYNDDFYYWEIVLLMRKSAIVLMIVFLQPVSSGVQSLTSILVLTIFYNVQLALEPYYDEALNQMESLSLLVIVLTIFGGLFYQAGQDETIMALKSVEIAIFLIVFVPTVVFTVNFLLKMRIEILKVAVNKSPKAFRFVTCGFSDINAFRSKYLDQKVEQESIESDENAPKVKSLHKSFKVRDKQTKFDDLGHIIDPNHVKFVPKNNQKVKTLDLSSLELTKMESNFNDKSKIFEADYSYASQQNLIKVNRKGNEPQSMLLEDNRFESGAQQSGEISDIYYSRSQIGRQPQSRQNSQHRIDSVRKSGKFIANNFQYANELEFGQKSQNGPKQLTQMLSGDELSVFKQSESSSSNNDDDIYDIRKKKDSRFRTVAGLKRNQSVSSFVSAEGMDEISARGRQMINSEMEGAAEVTFKAIPIGKLFVKKDIKRLEGRNQRELEAKSVQVSARRQNEHLYMSSNDLASKKIRGSGKHMKQPLFRNQSQSKFTPIKVSNKISQSVYNDHMSSLNNEENKVFVHDNSSQKVQKITDQKNEPQIMVGNFFKKLNKKAKVKEDDNNFGKVSASVISKIQSDLQSEKDRSQHLESDLDLDEPNSNHQPFSRGNHQMYYADVQRQRNSTDADGGQRRSSCEQNNTYGQENPNEMMRISQHTDSQQQTRDYKNLRKLIGRRVIQ